MGPRKAARTFDVANDSFRRRLQNLEKSSAGDNTDLIHKQLYGRFGNVLSKSQERRRVEKIYSWCD